MSGYVVSCVHFFAVMLILYLIYSGSSRVDESQISGEEDRSIGGGVVCSVIED